MPFTFSPLATLKRALLKSDTQPNSSDTPASDTTMASIAEQLPAANDKYVANFGDKGALALPPSKKVAIGAISIISTIIHPLPC